MIFLLLAYYVGESTFGNAGPIPLIEARASSECGDQESRRTVYSIVWSCLSTIFLCTWVAVHPNIAFRPDKGKIGWFQKWLWDPLREFLSYKLPLFLCALLVPEYILAWAIRQYLQAGMIKDLVPGWTRTHGFFLIMGGFHLFQLPDGASSIPLPGKSSDPSEFVIPSGRHSRSDETPVHPLGMNNIPIEILEIIAPTETELKDRGKSDNLTKLIVLVQTSWFIVQCIARGILHLPLTELEIVTLAYTMLNLFIYVFWWDKPRNVGCPIRIYKTPAAGHEEDKAITMWDRNWGWKLAERVLVYVIGYQDDYTTLHKERSVPLFWSGRPKELLLTGASLGPSILGAVFGAIHFIAWWYEFPSYIESLLWRISCVAMIVVPLIAAPLCLLMIPTENGWSRVIGFIFWALLVITSWLYVAGRIATLVIAFTTLRSLPSAALSNVDWTTFIPHI